MELWPSGLAAGASKQCLGKTRHILQTVAVRSHIQMLEKIQKSVDFVDN